MFIDVHCHLDLLKDIVSAIQRAKEAKIGRIVSAGVNYETNRKVLELGSRFNIVLSALGIYPIDALKMSEKGINSEIEFIRKNKDKIVGVGEVGLDFKESNERKRQEENFKKFIKLAEEIDKTIIVHSRKAEEKCVEILEDLMAKKVVMHCFCGSKKLIKRIVENGWSLSIPTNVNYSFQFQELVKEVPIDSLLCETDSPFLHPFRKSENEPANVAVSYEKIAEIKGMNLENVEKKIEDNFKRVFGV